MTLITKQTVAQDGTQVVQDTSLQHGHGASVADFIIKGIQDATSQPGAGGTDVKIMPIRDTSGGLNIDSNALIRGIYWAADHGASVINLSVNFNHDPVLDDPADPHNGAYLSQAIQYAETKGAVVVTGPGNSQTNIDQTVVFPPYADDAFYTDASPTPGNLLVAAAVDASGKLTSVSNWGPVHVDLGAYTSAAGATSYSSGYTAGVAGVIADMLPPGHTAADVVGIIKGTVTPHAQSVGAWSTTGGVINPAGCRRRGHLEGRVTACRRRSGRDLRRRCLLSRRDGLFDLGSDRHGRIAQPGPPGRSTRVNGTAISPTRCPTSCPVVPTSCDWISRRSTGTPPIRGCSTS